MNPTDPLAQLRDIHLPDPVSAWPPGPGWWVLAAVVLLLLAATVVWALRRHRRNAWRRSAQAALLSAHADWRESGDRSAYLQAVNSILKRTALARFPRADVASLNSQRWDAFLDQQWRKPPEQGFSDLGFGVLAYRPQGETDINQVHALCTRWVIEVEGAPC